LIKLRPKKKGEKVDEVIDDDVFKNLRRKLARWAADNAVAIKEVKPILPLNFTNRVAANWKLLLAIAELAGGNWPKHARDAAERLARTGRKPRGCNC
jgi:putative DNA primase/helicase